jgi:hypothetical protein
MGAPQQLLFGGGAASFLCDSADFDGTNDLMETSGDLTGNADGKTGTLSFWFRIDGAGTFRKVMTIEGPLSELNAKFSIVFVDFNQIWMQAGNTSDVVIMRLRSSSTFGVSATWHHFIASWNLAGPTGQIYIDGSSDVGHFSSSNDNIDYTAVRWAIGGTNNAGTPHQPFHGCLAEVWFDLSHIDLSSAANREKFRSSDGKPVSLGTTGDKPTGSAPLLYQHLDDGEAVANFATNRAGNGNFSITGTLDTGSSSPSD